MGPTGSRCSHSSTRPTRAGWSAHSQDLAAFPRSRVPEEKADWRRLRPNLVVDVPGIGRVEDEWVGRRLRVGRTVPGWQGRALVRRPAAVLADGDRVEVERGAGSRRNVSDRVRCEVEVEGARLAGARTRPRSWVHELGSGRGHADCLMTVRACWVGVGDGAEPASWRSPQGQSHRRREGVRRSVLHGSH